MITIDFSSSNISLCDSIYTQIKQQILIGKLKASEKLPSKRAFADHLGVSVITVQNAYDLLIGEGFIYSIEKKGYFVTDVASKKILTIKETSSVSNKTLTETIEKTVSYYADFESNATSSEKFPFNLWVRTMRQVLNSGDEKLLCRVGVKGVLELREAISKYLMEYRNMQVSPCQIVIGAGTESLYSMIVQLLGREKKYAVENPGYHKVADIVELNGASCIPVNIDKSGMSIKALSESDCEVAHVSPFHHFPTGIVMPIKRRLELLAWAEKSSSRYIIEDDYDSEFRFNGKPVPPLQSFDSSSRVIYINTFSKTLSPSFRISYMVLPKNLVKDFDEKLGFYSCPVSSFEQYTLAHFINSGDFGKHITRMRNYYRSVRNELV
ncbi:MAG: PLP-dependent aminotransferase family protein, partial [Treponema sp.]|nr:PLP-dependent aminotransferase family protein [Treponema sp.]